MKSSARQEERIQKRSRVRLTNNLSVRKRRILCTLLPLLVCLLPSQVRAANYGVNLVVNGNAEMGPFSATGNVVAVPGWNTSGTAFTVVDYKQPGDSSGFPAINSHGPLDRGNQFFAGGFGTPTTASQDIDVSANAVDIDAGTVVCDIFAWLGGYLSDEDNARLTITFQDSSSTNLGLPQTLGPVTAAQRFNQTGLFYVRSTTTVPAQARRIHVELTMTRTAGAFNDGYADSLSVVLRKPMVVTTVAESGLGSLRDAMQKGNIITFDPNVFASEQAITLTAALPQIVGDTTIIGPGANLLTVRRSTSNGRRFGVFDITNGLSHSPGPRVVLAGLTVSNGVPGITNSGSQLTLDSCIITGNGVADGAPLGGILSVDSSLDLVNCIISNNANVLGGGIHVDGSAVSLTNCTISNNIAYGQQNANLEEGQGGGIWARGGSLSLLNCTIASNSAEFGPSDGGGIYTRSTSLSLLNCTIAYNVADSGAGAFFFSTPATVTNCTFSQNRATDGKSSGLNSQSGYLGIDSCTFYGNSGAIRFVSSIVLVKNAIFNASDVDLTNAGDSAFTDSGYNLSDENDPLLTQPTDKLGTGASLGYLRNNGGPTFTHALFPGSPAINNGAPDAPSQDQRYYRRSGAPDIGAFESGGTLAPMSAVSRKMHGASDFDINLPLVGTAGIECRSGGASGDHLIVVTFPTAVTLGSAQVVTGTGNVLGVDNDAAGELTIHLTGVTNAQTIVTTLFGVNDGVHTQDVTIPMGVLLGDTSGNGSVNASDVSLAKLKSGQAVDSSNFREDVTVNGSINASDVSSVKLKSGTALPP